ncbi:MAG: thiamine pyrophosphate-dependent enzyme [Spirochaetia bacterium]|nr:thiamine pyrophosphate-dependent enzyme [Spirochaetia bacterium]
MKQLGELLIQQEAFSEIMMGNSAVVRAMVEEGTRVVTAYPGSPTPEIGGAIMSIQEEQRPFYFEFSVNEKVATEVAFGASVNGHLSTVFKSVGLNVAADSFVQLPLMELVGGMVIIIGDDPGANSSQNEQDNRHYARMAYCPVFEPGDPQEVYEMYRDAAKLSKEMKMPVILRLSTHICHAKARVSFGPYEPREASREPRFDPENGPYIPLTEKALRMKRRALEKLDRVAEYAENSPLNRLDDNGNKRMGVVAGGLPYYSLLDVLFGASTRPDIFKLAMSYPLPRQRLAEFCRSHDEVLVLEELDPIIEGELKAIAFDEGISVKICGKGEREDLIGEYKPAKTRRILSRRWPQLLPAEEEQSAATELAVPERPPQMCPGCGHRSAFHAIKRVIKKDIISVADIGCHTLGALPPYNMGQVLLCMGHSNGTGSGLSLFNDSRNVITFIGDSTFFHAGLPGVANSVYNDHNITLIILLNDTTAMTGHQDHPGTGKTTHAGVGQKIKVRSVLEGLGVKHIGETDTYNQKRLGELLKEAMEIEGFTAVIARHPCMLKFTRERRRAGHTIQTQAAIDQETCNQIHHCVGLFACPSFVRHPGGQVTVNQDLCIGDGSCLQTCPVNAIELKKVDEQ